MPLLQGKENRLKLSRANPAISVPASAELVPAQWRPWDELFLESLAEQGLSLHLFPESQGPEQ